MTLIFMPPSFYPSSSVMSYFGLWRDSTGCSSLKTWWISGRWPVLTLWPKGRGQEPGFHTGGELSLPTKGAALQVTVSSVGPSSSLLWGWYPPGLSQPLSFPMGSCFLLFGLFCLLLQREFGGQADGSPEQTIPLEQHYSGLGDPDCQETYFCPRILHRNQTIITLLPDKKITCKPWHPTKRIISGLVIH